MPRRPGPLCKMEQWAIWAPLNPSYREVMRFTAVPASRWQIHACNFAQSLVGNSAFVTCLLYLPAAPSNPK
jgi:hypothetical protein